jgi:hypothetical protein
VLLSKNADTPLHRHHVEADDPSHGLRSAQTAAPARHTVRVSKSCAWAPKMSSKPVRDCHRIFSAGLVQSGNDARWRLLSILRARKRPSHPQTQRPKEMGMLDSTFVNSPLGASDHE